MSMSFAICTPLKLRQRRRLRMLSRTTSLMYCIVLELDAVHIGLPKRTAVHTPNLVHRFAVKGRIADVDPVLKPTHAVFFVGSIRLNGNARHEDAGLGALGRAAACENKGNNNKNECFFHCKYGLKVKKLVAF
jgi:hypothetical protein